MIDARDARSDRPAEEDRSDSPAASGRTSVSAHRTSDPSDASPSVLAIAVWLLLQLIVLSLSAVRVPLWYRAPDPVERWGVQQMLTAQIVLSALLFPWLMRNRATSACVILVSAPMIHLAATLAEAGLASTALAWAYVALWMAGLAAWQSALRSPRDKLLGVALAGALVVGGPALRYLRLEFAQSPASETLALAWLDPITAALSISQNGGTRPVPWTLPASLVVTRACAALLSRRRRADVTSYPHV